MARYLATLVSLVLAVVVPFSALALGLGEIDLRSGLNQRFDAEIPVTSESAIDLTDLSVELASMDTFNQFGLDRPAFLTGFQFVLVTRGDNTAIQVTSAKPVVEPFVTLLLEISWPQGRLLREYTVLLDPPAFAAAEVETAVQEPVAGPAPIPDSDQIVRSASPAPALTVEPAETIEPVEPVETVEPTPAVEAAEPVVAVAPNGPAPAVESESASPEPAAAPMADDTYGPVGRNDTLWSIAGGVSTDGLVNRNQIMLAIFRANPEAFAGNINRLKAGVILRIPDIDELERLGSREARAEVQRQNTAWKPVADDTGRLRLVPPPESGAGESQAAQTAGGNAERAVLQQRVEGLQLELSDSQRLIALRDQELQALQQQLAALEERLDATAQANVQDSAGAEPLVPDDVGVGDEAEPVTGVDAGAEIEPGEAADGSETVGETADVVAEPFQPPPVPAPVIGTEAPDVVTTAPQEESSWLAALFSNTWLYVGLFLVALAALFVAFRRPSKSRGLAAGADEPAHEIGEPSLNLSTMSPEDESFIVEEVLPEQTIQRSLVEGGDEESWPDIAAGEVAGEQPEEGTSGWETPATAADSEEESYPPVPAEPEPAAEPFGAPESVADQESPLERTISISSAADLDEADPMAEADFHMAYGLYDQAAGRLSNALAAEPERKDLRLKLLEVYFIWENSEGFLKEAGLLRDRLEGEADPDWNKVLIMGKQICPDEALFSATPEAPGEAEAMDLAFTDDTQGSDDYDVDIPLAGGAEDSLNISVEDMEEEMSSLDMTNIDKINPELLNFDLPGDDSTGEAETIDSPVTDAMGDALAADLDLADVDLVDEEPTVETPTADMPAFEPTPQETISELGADSIDAPAFEPTEIIKQIDPDENEEDSEPEVTDLEVTDTFIDLEEDDLLEMPSLDLAAETLNTEMDDDTNLGEIDMGIPEPPAGFDLRGDEELPSFEPTVVIQDMDDAGAGFDDATVEQFTGGAAARSGSDMEYEGATMTEVGTKLDLARAYIDMGDPDGARSILNEVLEEAGDSQRQEAQQLLTDLG